MNLLARTIFCESILNPISMQYLSYRRNLSSRYASTLMTLAWVICWCVFILESPRWRHIRKNRKQLFPQISETRPKGGDIPRYIIQSIYLILVHQPGKQHTGFSIARWLNRVIKRYYSWMTVLFLRFRTSSHTKKNLKSHWRMPKRMRQLVYVMLTALGFWLFLLCVTQPFAPIPQFIFLMILWWVAMSIRNLPGRGIIILLAVLSLIVSCRYLWWRYSYTLIWSDPTSMIFGTLLILAETYIWAVLVLGYFQSIWPLHREPVPLPDDTNTWPSVDIFITTYTEALSIIKPGVYACLGMDWPKNKMNIYILDDGHRESVKAFAEEVGVYYIARPEHKYAKAGNINHGLECSDSELVAIFDCDHIPTHTFLQLTVGWFLKDPKLALLQTPHHFFSPDPFERNLGSFQQTPNESALFYGVVQDGNDTWNASYFCGSGGILRRSALRQIGGFATESVTEDALTSLRLQRLGYSSAYIRIPLSAGLATETLSGHIGQRIRWARGMIQILRIDNPFRGKGLSLPQRLCYFNAMLHFLSGIPRLIFYITPAAFIILKAYIIHASALILVLYAFPHIAHSIIANTKIQGRYRHFLWNEIYETVMAWYIAIPTTIALINPRAGSFNVTAKGGLIDERFADWKTARPYIVLLAINLTALIWGICRIFSGPSSDIPALLITIFWVVYNLAILGGAMGVDIESKQIRKSHRVEFTMTAAVVREDGHAYPCMLTNYSDNGVGVTFEGENWLQDAKKAYLLLHHDNREYSFPCDIARTYGLKAGLQLSSISYKQHIDFIQCTFARADTWVIWASNFKEEQPMHSLMDVLKFDIQGYRSIIEFSPPLIKKTILHFFRMISWIFSFAPHMISNKPKELAPKRIFEPERIL
jgi:cellulose synthase (UDP-forming)